jgi:hypothetical protein
MSEVEEYRRRADECFRKYQAGDQYARFFWLGLSKQWARMADESEALPSTALSSPADHLEKLRDVLEEALSERALALCAARIGSGGGSSTRSD